MSLLMQALKKAERAKQNHAPDEELAKPSEAYDEVLALAPHEQAASAEPLTLSPLDAAPAAARAEPSIDFAPEAPRMAVPDPQAEPPAPPPRRARNAPPPPPRVKAQKRAMARMDARTIRIAVLGSIALLIAAVFAYIYWNAVYGPGSSRHLPMVPMPGQNQSAALDPGAAAPGVAVIAAQPGADVPIQAAQPVQPYVAQAPAPSSRDQIPPDEAMRLQQLQQQQQPPAQAAPRPSTARAPAAPADSSGIRVARVSKPEQINPSLQNGFTAYNNGDLPAARQSYQTVLRQDANNRDALLGMAALAARDNQAEQAASIYARLLELDPHDNDALAGLTSVRQGDPAQSEARLRRVVERNPESGPLLFALGNLYARQGRWPEAQQHYFRAYSASPNNADYAFNLAIGLDRLNQGKLALTYYQRAVELAQRGAVNFDRNAAATRARELGGQ
ncbi:tetratricopeptide repeat protein [Massilia pseudoviolaceinigra]|uniref:tetratricopeptide repeat protein n=1 Tax=Massilia pseudoviolaceinigra TaxID=3057165 RepID=UPI002796A112|nr:tetratricopeptide repeat protein [Massilia sp. CCM 9206]MDQ1921136.1 tetratricopeptide repeat protein [Massilia sp. CCM 9206]